MARSATDPLFATRAVLAFGCLAGLTTYIFTPLEHPEQVMLASDVYVHAVASLLDGTGLYDVHPPDRRGYTFLYPPIATIPFLPHAILGSPLAAYLLQSVLNVGAALGTAVVIYRALVRRDRGVDRGDLVLLSFVMLVSSYSAIQFINGQVTLWLAFALAVGFDALDRNRAEWAGLAFALAALVKVFPAVIGLWLLRLRAWRAVGVAVATGLSGIVLGALLLGPELTATYFVDVLAGRFDGSTYTGRPNPHDNVDGIHRQLAALWPAGTRFHTPVALLVVGALVALGMRRVDDTVERDVAALATIVGILLFLPLQPLYFPLITFPLLMLLYSNAVEIPRGLLLGGTALTFIHLDQVSVSIALSILRVPDPVAESILSISASVFTVVLPPTLGLWVLLLTCVFVQLPAGTSERSRGALPTPADD